MPPGVLLGVGVEGMGGVFGDAGAFEVTGFFADREEADRLCRCWVEEPARVRCAGVPVTSLEQAMLPHAAGEHNPTRLFGTYNTVATLAGSVGALVALVGS